MMNSSSSLKIANSGKIQVVTKSFILISDLAPFFCFTSHSFFQPSHPILSFPHSLPHSYLTQPTVATDPARRRLACRFGLPLPPCSLSTLRLPPLTADPSPSTNSILSFFASSIPFALSLCHSHPLHTSSPPRTTVHTTLLLATQIFSRFVTKHPFASVSYFSPFLFWFIYIFLVCLFFSFLFWFVYIFFSIVLWHIFGWFNSGLYFYDKRNLKSELSF